ncbi:MAG: response regulator [Pyrinomonadaceae bacterium]
MDSITILCIDEYELMLLTMQHMLEYEGWRVEAFRDAAQALKKLESDSRYDVIIVSEKLPGMSGLEVLRRVRELNHRRQTPIVMFASLASEAQARLLGVEAVLQKPHDIRHLTEVVARCLCETTTGNSGEAAASPAHQETSATDPQSTRSCAAAGIKIISAPLKNTTSSCKKTQLRAVRPQLRLL